MTTDKRLFDVLIKKSCTDKLPTHHYNTIKIYKNKIACHFFSS